MDKLAVYGTLKNESHPKGIIRGYQLWDIPSRKFPYIIHTGNENETVTVEVLDVNKSMLKDYDNYECVYDGMYVRTRVPVLVDGETINAWVYVAGPTLLGCDYVVVRIKNGDYIANRPH